MTRISDVRQGRREPHDGAGNDYLMEQMSPLSTLPPTRRQASHKNPRGGRAEHAHARRGERAGDLTRLIAA